MDYCAMSRTELYKIGVLRALAFCKVNHLEPPEFWTYEQAMAETESFAARRLNKAIRGQLVGQRTGLYFNLKIFINLNVTAAPVRKPGMRSWSYPCYKVDRTPIGVIAHELGHYIEHKLQLERRLKPEVHGPAWRELITAFKKQVSSYEPVPSEAWAESMRLYILNPDLLRRGLYQRYQFIKHEVGLKVSEKRSFDKVLAHPAYIKACENWF